MTMTFGKKIAPRVLTSRGPVPMDNLLMGDIVFEFNTGKALEVGKVELVEGSVYMAIYSDQRQLIIPGSDSMLVNNIDGIKIINPSEFNVNRYNGMIHINRIDFENMDSSTSTNDGTELDPYTLAPFIVFGNFCNPHVNIPSYCLEDINRDSIRLYDWLKIRIPDFEDLYSTDHLIYLRKRDKTLMTWNELCPNFENTVLGSNEFCSGTVSEKFLLTSIHNRLQFIRGVFDYGISRYLSGTELVLGGESSDRLAFVQKVLASLGIESVLFHDQTLTATSKRLYFLKVMNGNLPELFHNRDDVSDLVNAVYKRPSYETECYIQQIIVKKISSGMSSYRIILEKPSVIYAANMLPIVTH